MRYWWVNHKQTVRQEIDGGYLWSPKKEANGNKSQFYLNMKKTTPGDVVLSYANGQVGHIGIVQDFAFTAPKPNEFGNSGSTWSAIGWCVPVAWRKLPSPVKLKEALADLTPLLPEKYSPINAKSGRGNQKAYLTAIDANIMAVISRLSGADPDRPQASVRVSNYVSLADEFDRKAEIEIEALSSLSDTEKRQLVQARRGQGIFKANVMTIEKRCRLTRVENPLLLVASHIKPWRLCKSATERLDKFNGFLLAPHVDRLFDRGLISFADDGAVLVSSKIDKTDIERIGLAEAIRSNVGPFLAEQRSYLLYHRSEIFLD